MSGAGAGKGEAGAVCRLHYFDVKALGEGLRLLLAYGGQPFEDKRYSMEEWQQYKPKTPFGQMPVLELEGQTYTQSGALARYLGRRYGLAGASAEEDLHIDMAVDLYGDLRANAAAAHYEQDATHKERKFQEKAAAVQLQLDALERLAKDNGGHLALHKLTWGDFVVAGMHDYLKVMLRRPDLDSSHPHLRAVVDNVLALPQLRSYLANAPKNPY